MGHLSNPIGFRLGFQKNWKHNWFVKNLYYPELLNDMLNIRDYLYYYMTRSAMLRSGFCLSHFYMYKWRKSYYIKVYIYQIDLEKLSYDFINQAFLTYYEVYNKSVKRKWSKRNKFIVKYFRDLTNSDLYVFYFIFTNFIAQAHSRKKFKNYKYKQLLCKNLYLNNLEALDYSYMLSLDYINLILFKIKKRFTLNEGGRLIRYYKLLRNEKWYVKRKFKKLNFAALQILKKKKKERTPEDYNLLEHCLKLWYKRKRKKIYFFFFLRMQKKIKKNLRKLTGLRRTPSDPYFFRRVNKVIKFNDDNKDSLENNYNYNYKAKYKINFIDLFFFLAKKVGFQKFNNSFTLNEKWKKLLKYLKIFNQLRFQKDRLNIKSFFFMISLYIYASRRANAAKRRFNFRKSIYISMYVCLAKENFTGTLKLVTFYLKHMITVLCRKIKYDNIFFVYFFMTNQNVTSQLISRYIALKLKKNFSVLKVLNPLKRELNRLSRQTRTSKNAYRYYNYNALFRITKKKARMKIKSYLFRYRKFFKDCNYTYYVNNWLFISFNTFYYHKNYNRYYNFIPKKKRYTVKYLKFLKVFFINTYYQLILNIYKGNKLICNNNTLVFNLLKWFNISLLLKYKKLLKNTTILVFLSSYFYKNLFNFKLIRFIWEQSNKINARNVRQLYIPRHKSILMGYKIAFRGRFSRKQRASFIWTQVGKVPLNTLSISVDYSFFTIPLKNSAVSIKVWLYKLKNFVKFKYYLKI